MGKLKKSDPETQKLVPENPKTATEVTLKSRLRQTTIKQNVQTQPAKKRVSFVPLHSSPSASRKPYQRNAIRKSSQTSAPKKASQTGTAQPSTSMKGDDDECSSQKTGSPSSNTPISSKTSRPKSKTVTKTASSKSTDDAKKKSASTLRTRDAPNQTSGSNYDEHQVNDISKSIGISKDNMLPDDSLGQQVRSGHATPPIKPVGLIMMSIRIVENLNWDYLDSDELDINTKFNTFHENIADAASIAFPIKSKPLSKKPNGFKFTLDLKQLRADLQFVSELHNNCPSERLALRKSELRKTYRKKIEQAKAQHNDSLIKISTNPNKTM
ncbi:hypothetical protein WDU94_010710 [Cyamophila willieti]